MKLMMIKWKMRRKRRDTEVLHDKPEFSSDSEKEGEAADVQKDGSTCSLVWKTANGESVTESTEAPEPEEEPPKDLGKAMAQKSTGRVGSRKGRGRGRKGPTTRQKSAGRRNCHSSRL